MISPRSQTTTLMPVAKNIAGWSGSADPYHALRPSRPYEAGRDEGNERMPRLKANEGRSAAAGVGSAFAAAKRPMLNLSRRWFGAEGGERHLRISQRSRSGLADDALDRPHGWGPRTLRVYLHAAC